MLVLLSSLFVKYFGLVSFWVLILWFIFRVFYLVAVSLWIAVAVGARRLKHEVLHQSAGNVWALLTAQAVKMLSVPLWLRCGDDFVSEWQMLCTWWQIFGPQKQADWFTASVSCCFSPAVPHLHRLPSDISDIPEVPVCLPPPHRESRQCSTSPLRSCWPEIALVGLRLRNAPSHWWSSTSCSGVCFWLHAGTEGQGE